jgi:hypothetical protein
MKSEIGKESRARSQEPGTRNQEPGKVKRWNRERIKSQEPGTRKSEKVE